MFVFLARFRISPLQLNTLTVNQGWFHQDICVSHLTEHVSFCCEAEVSAMNKYGCCREHCLVDGEARTPVACPRHEFPSAIHFRQNSPRRFIRQPKKHQKHEVYTDCSSPSRFLTIDITTFIIIVFLAPTLRVNLCVIQRS